MLKFTLTTLLTLATCAPSYSAIHQKEYCFPFSSLKEEPTSAAIATLQMSHMKYVKLGKRDFIPFDSHAVQQGMELLSGLRQAPSGGIFNPKSKAISIKENAKFLSYATMLQGVFIEQLSHKEQLTPQEIQDIEHAITRINEILYGEREHRGLLTFFRETAYEPESGMFYDSLHLDRIDPEVDYNLEANILALTVLGQPFLDNAYGLGTSWQLWQKIKIRGGFDNPPRICCGPSPSPYTPLAVNLLRCLIAQYTIISREGATEDDRTHAKEFAYFLQIDHDALLGDLVDKAMPCGPYGLWIPLLSWEHNPYSLSGEYHFGHDGSVPESN